MDGVTEGRGGKRASGNRFEKDECATSFMNVSSITRGIYIALYKVPTPPKPRDMPAADQPLSHFSDILVVASHSHSRRDYLIRII
jgi:hypothetical protein